MVMAGTELFGAIGGGEGRRDGARRQQAVTRTQRVLFLPCSMMC